MSFHDDLESVIFMMLAFLTDTIPEIVAPSDRSLDISETLISALAVKEKIL